MEKLHKAVVPPAKRAANSRKAKATLARGVKKADERTLAADRKKEVAKSAARVARVAATERTKDKKSKTQFKAFLTRMEKQVGGRENLQEKLQQLVADNKEKQLAERLAEIRRLEPPLTGPHWAVVPPNK